MKKTLLQTLAFTLINFVVLAQEGGGSKTTVTDSTIQSEAPFSVSVESAFTNSYLWRGIQFNKGLILQPAVTMEYKGFSLNIWNSTSILETNENETIQELDFTLLKSIEAGNFYFEPTLLLYTYPTKNSLTATAEASLYAAYFKGSFGVFMNPATDILSNAGGAFSEVGFTFDNETEYAHSVLNLAYGAGNKKFSEYNITVDEPGLVNSSYKLIDLNGYFQKSLSETIYLKPSFSFFHILGSDFTNFLSTNQLNLAISIGAEF